MDCIVKGFFAFLLHYDFLLSVCCDMTYGFSDSHWTYREN